MSASASRSPPPFRPRRQPGVVAEDRGLEAPHRLARLEAELVERRPVGVVGGERVGMTARGVQRAHQKLAGPLAQRVLADERLELRDDVGRAPELDVGGDPLLDGDQPELVEAPGLGLRPLLESELGERRAAPEIERAQEDAATLLRSARPRVGEQLLEAPRVDLLRRDREHVPGRTRDDDVGSERLPERDDGVLQRRGRIRRRIGAVELVDELLGRNNAPGAQEQGGQEGALARPPEADRALLAPHLERAEDQELLHARAFVPPFPTAS